MSNILKVSGFTAVKKPEVAVSNPALDHFLTSFGHSLTRSYFLSTKFREFFDNILWFFIESAFILKNDPFSDVTETNGSFSKFFKQLRKNY